MHRLSALAVCPKNCNFRRWMSFRSRLSSPISSRIDWFVRCAFRLIHTLYCNLHLQELLLLARSVYPCEMRPSGTTAVTEGSSSSDNMLSSLSSVQREEIERNLERSDRPVAAVERQPCAVKSPDCTEKFVSTKETAKSRWHLAYVKFRHSVADRLGTSI